MKLNILLYYRNYLYHWLYTNYHWNIIKPYCIYILKNTVKYFIKCKNVIKKTLKCILFLIKRYIKYYFIWTKMTFKTTKFLIEILLKYIQNTIKSYL
jgi:hypothetical protein